ncbi:hypothetical protein NQ314_019215 [Rhamnusium bicolor]|uniref:Transposable element P transposase-like RNase H domain-containing protein n=1 Tax=Rhamnusium bicolor TaxID=1586634 RepID=A0AAV8WP97_9CUCU|nr:hypothetical protein NQ314_019215 [Rhamnusium bicolor]
MVVAVNGSWKLPIAYFLIHSLTAVDKANIIKEALIKLHECGVTIISLTCDGSSVNFSVMQELGAIVNDINNIESFFTHHQRMTPKYLLYLMLVTC